MLPEPAEDGTLEIVAPDNDAADDGEKTAPVAKAPTSDPLRLYVRQIGDGPAADARGRARARPPQG